MKDPQHPQQSRGDAVSRLQSVTLDGPAGPLEGLLQEHEGREPSLVSVVCHPHPLYGGTLHNKVVHRVASVLHGLGATVLRFNFRGVGTSAGSHDEGMGEVDDARAALAWLRARHPSARAWVAGFSFGSWIAARLAASDPAIARLILVAPPVDRGFESLRTAPVPKHVVQGTRDELCPPAALEREYATWAEPKSLRMVEGATHFFDKQLAELAEALLEALRDPARAITSSDT